MVKKKYTLIIVIMTGVIFLYMVIANIYEIIKLEWITLIDQKRCSNYITLPSGWSENTNYTINTTKDLEVILLDSYKGEIKVKEKVVIEGGRPCIFFVTKESVKANAEIIFEEVNGEIITYKVIIVGKTTYYLVRSKY